MKQISILSENYIRSTDIINTSSKEITKLLENGKSVLNQLLDKLFLNENLSIESPEFFEFRSTPLIKGLMQEDFNRELTDIIFESKCENSIELKKAVKCAHCVDEIEKPTEHNHTDYDKINNLFGFDSQLDDKGLILVQNTVDIPEFHKTIGKINDAQEEAKKQITETMNNIGKFDRDALTEAFTTLLYVKAFVDSYK